jgi:hypothetical protein
MDEISRQARAQRQQHAHAKFNSLWSGAKLLIQRIYGAICKLPDTLHHIKKAGVQIS